MRTLIEISRGAITNNVKVFRKLVGKKKLLGICVKANAYGHGLVEVSEIALQAGADWLIVDSLEEGVNIREAGIEAPILIVGYVTLAELEKVFEYDFRITVYNKQTTKRLEQIAKKLKKSVRIHLKIETGTSRQGILPKEIIPFVKNIKSELVEIEGASTHFANIEDVLEPDFAEKQLETFKSVVELLKANKVKIKISHCANSAATILFPETYLDLVRVGVSTYGMWPSEQTRLSAHKKGRQEVSLRPAMTMKSIVAQIKDVPPGSCVGYGCTYEATKKTKIAVIPIGYYDGYDRKISNSGYVLIHGKRVPLRGRVCMNMIMVDISDIPNVRLEDPVVILGKQQSEEITAEQLAEWMGTINYEVTTKFRETLSRVVKK